MDWKSIFIPLAANALITFLHHALYVRPAQVRIAALSARQNEALQAVVQQADQALQSRVDQVVAQGAEKLQGK